MPKIAKELSALEVKRLTHQGTNKKHYVAVGGVGGLTLQITPNGHRSWLLRTSMGKRRPEYGLGSYPEISLSVARDRARALKEKIRDGIDPKAERKQLKLALEAQQKRNLQFKEAVDRYLDTKLDEYSNPKHRQQWRNTLKTYAVPLLGNLLVQDIMVPDILRVLKPIWHEKTETASRLRGRIEAVLSWATVEGYREGDNPARWAGNLKEALPAPHKIANEKNPSSVAD